MTAPIPAILRRLVDVLEEVAGDLAESKYICDQLGAQHYKMAREFNREDRWDALEYLRTLGLGEGMGEFYTEEESFDINSFFSDSSIGIELRLHRRQAWLSFAADLYEEGVAC